MDTSPTNGREEEASGTLPDWPTPLFPFRGRAVRSMACKGLFFSAWRKKSEPWLGTAETLTGHATLERASEGKGP